MDEERAFSIFAVALAAFSLAFSIWWAMVK